MNAITPAGQLAQVAALRPEKLACSFMGRKFTYSELMKLSEDCARAFAAIGVHENCRVMLHMPLIPQAMGCFYGLNMLGAAAVIPASAPLSKCLRTTQTRAVVTTDGLYGSLEDIPELPTTIVARPQDTMGKLKKLSYMLTDGRSAEKISEGYGLLSWDGFMLGGKAYRGEHRSEERLERTAVIICAEDTTSLTNGSFTFAELQLPIIKFHQSIINGSCPELDI